MANKFLADAVRCYTDNVSSIDGDKTLRSRLRRAERRSTMYPLFEGDDRDYRGIVAVRVHVKSNIIEPSVRHAVFGVHCHDQDTVDPKHLYAILTQDKTFAPVMEKRRSIAGGKILKELIVRYFFSLNRPNENMESLAGAFMSHEYPLLVIDATANTQDDKRPLSINFIAAVPKAAACDMAGIPTSLPKSSYPNRKVKLGARPSGAEIDELAMAGALDPLKKKVKAVLAEKPNKAKATSLSGAAKADAPSKTEHARRQELIGRATKLGHLERDALPKIQNSFGPILSAGSVISRLIALSREDETVAEYLATVFARCITK